ncbi:hypothetical protein [Acidihalobacter prosperus]|uniref:Uncharacterized protein n=1 Tax=Acidihalobacter prosperus TaxID=160660 RepID=A0A1A6C3K4_9GAMM|nr:hypothetical protein [Acidihalobacter prosperus]OBS09125.1 hypothetical protein Thpro_021453 [Acidihalobacter prosperus]
MDDNISLLAAQAAAPSVTVNAALDEALRALDRRIEVLAEALQVEYLGPGIGMLDMDAEHVFRLAVRHHVWDVAHAGWGVKVCDALPNGGLRPMWPIHGVGRLRKQQLVRALPAFFQGYVTAVAAAGKAGTPAGRELQALAESFG